MSEWKERETGVWPEQGTRVRIRREDGREFEGFMSEDDGDGVVSWDYPQVLGTGVGPIDWINEVTHYQIIADQP